MEMSLGRRSIAEMVCELVLTCGFLLVIMGVTDRQRAPAGFAPLAIGLALTLIHLISIPVTNTSVNPARSTGVALFAGGAPRVELFDLTGVGRMLNPTAVEIWPMKRCA